MPGRRRSAGQVDVQLSLPALPRLMPHQKRQIGVIEHVAGDAAEEGFAPFAVRISAHNDEVRAKLVRFLQKLLANGAMTIDGVDFGRDAILFEDGRDHGVFRLRVQDMNGFRLFEKRHGGEDGFLRADIVFPGDGDHSAKVAGALWRSDASAKQSCQRPRKGVQLLPTPNCENKAGKLAPPTSSNFPDGRLTPAIRTNERCSIGRTRGLADGSRLLWLRASHPHHPELQDPGHTDVIQREGISKSASRSRGVFQ